MSMESLKKNMIDHILSYKGVTPEQYDNIIKENTEKYYNYKYEPGQTVWVILGTREDNLIALGVTYKMDNENTDSVNVWIASSSSYPRTHVRP